MGNNINKNTQKLPQTYAFLGEGKIISLKNINKDNKLQSQKIVIIQKVISFRELENYRLNLSRLKDAQGEDTQHNLLLPLEQSFSQEPKKLMCSQNQIITLQYKFTNLQNTLEAQFLRSQSQSVIHQNTRDGRNHKQNKKIALSKFHPNDKGQSYFQQDQLLSFFKAMASTADIFHKWTNKSANYKLAEMLIQADSLQLQIFNCLTLPTFESVYQQYLANPSRIVTLGQSQDLQYLAPEQWCYLKRQAQIKPCNKKSQIFIIGKNILKLMCLNSLQYLYDKQYFSQKFKIQPHKHSFGKAGKAQSPPDWYFNQLKHFYNQEIMLSSLNEASNRYSKNLVNMVRSMVSANYLQRPSASQILQFLNNFHEKSQNSIYERLIPAMNSERNQKIENHYQKKNINDYHTHRSSNRKKKTNASSGQIITIGKNSSRQKDNTKFVTQACQKSQFGCIPLDINAQMVFSEYISFKQSARESTFT